jgi:hypothetical protein
MVVCKMVLMKRRKYLIYMLAVLNAVLLLAIGAVVGSRMQQTEQQENTDLPGKGKGIAEILGQDFSIPKEVLQTQARRVIFLFYRDSSFAKSIEYVHQFSQCVSPSPVTTVLFIVVCSPREKCENIRVFEVDNFREPFSVRYYSDERNTLRRRFAVHHAATVIADARSLEVTESYPYLLNPFVLCELLDREKKNAN